MWAVRISPKPVQGSASSDRKRLLNSPGHSALLPNLPQSFSRKVGFFARCCCRLLELTFRLLAFACFTSGLFQLPAVPQPRRWSGARRRCASARPKGSRTREEGADRARCLGRSWVRGAGSTHSALEAPARRVPGLVETTWATLRPHPRAVGSHSHRSPTRRLSHCGSQSMVFGGLFLQKCSVL